MKPPAGPPRGAQPRTLRQRALEIGTSPSGFPDNADGNYNTQAGAPEKDVSGTYKSNVTNPGANPDSPLPNPSPFKTGPL